MELRKLGKTEIVVSELCFGTLPMGPLQANISEEEGGALILEALEKGVNFLDTAQQYGTYGYMRRALDRYHGSPVIASKSMAEDYEGMRRAVEEALEALGRKYIDIFHLHAPRAVPGVLAQRREALQCLVDFRSRGLIKATGIATHNVGVVEEASLHPGIDIVFALINSSGRGILGGSREEMAQAIEKARKNGKGTYAMKVLAGGHLIPALPEALAYVRSLPQVDALSVGMVSSQELNLNLRLFQGEDIPGDELPRLNQKKLIILDFVCKNCQSCLEACPNDALISGEEVVAVDRSRCLLCGYCLPHCPEMAMRIV